MFSTTHIPPFQCQAKHLELLRNERNWTKKTVYEKLNVMPKTYYSWELGSKRPDTEHLLDLASLYNVSCDYILGLSESRNIGNAEIEKATGLTETSIEALHFFNSPDYDKDDKKVHAETIGFINLVLSEYRDLIIRYKSDPSSNTPVETIFATMMDYITSKSDMISLSYWQDGIRQNVSGHVVTIEINDKATGYTISELAKMTILQRIEKWLIRTQEQYNKREEG